MFGRFLIRRKIHLAISPKKKNIFTVHIAKDIVITIILQGRSEEIARSQVFIVFAVGSTRDERESVFLEDTVRVYTTMNTQ